MEDFHRSFTYVNFLLKHLYIDNINLSIPQLNSKDSIIINWKH